MLLVDLFFGDTMTRAFPSDGPVSRGHGAVLSKKAAGLLSELQVNQNCVVESFAENYKVTRKLNVRMQGRLKCRNCEQGTATPCCLVVSCLPTSESMETFRRRWCPGDGKSHALATAYGLTPRGLEM